MIQGVGVGRNQAFRFAASTRRSEIVFLKLLICGIIWIMLKKKRAKATETQIPADLFVSIHAPQARRKRWILDVLISLIIVVGLLAAGMLVYKKVHHAVEPSTVTSQPSKQVLQSPQQTTNTHQPTSEPATTPVSNSTNNTTIPQPN
jgi:uncharacterized membrane protein